MNKSVVILILAGVLASSCNTKKKNSGESKAYNTTGTIERIDPALDSIIAPGAKAEIIADSFDWCEGPLWIESRHMLLFSDVPKNTIYKWTEENGTGIYLKPSGYTGFEPSVCKEPGSNGLLFDTSGQLVLCQHGDRRMARMEAALDQPEAKFITLADKYEGKRFSSPNDAVFNRLGELFFTDPPYGLHTQDDTDPKKEIPFNGVYRLSTEGKVSLVTGSISRPNGIAFFPGEERLIVASSDPAKPVWWEIATGPDDTIYAPKIFYSAEGSDTALKGLPDGLKIDKNGIVFATGPGGIWIFNKEAKLLGKIRLDNAASNCALSADQKTLYITNDMYVLRVKMRD
ncbi:MAG: SMP-30/gluconolactonase/LRE family protein [Chitinophagaceae bacterium]